MKLRLIVLFIFVSVIASAQSENMKEYFDFQIIQENQAVPVIDHEVTLRRKPFTLVIILKEKIGVLTNFSVNPLLYDGFSHGKSLEKILEEPDLFMGMAEYDFNPEKRIFIDNIAAHYLYYDSEKAHRFSRAEIKDNIIYGYRDIDFFQHRSYDPIRKIENLQYDILYVVFMYMEYDDDWNRIEKQSDFLKINFR